MLRVTAAPKDVNAHSFVKLFSEQKKIFFCKKNNLKIILVRTYSRMLTSSGHLSGRCGEYFRLSLHFIFDYILFHFGRLKGL